MRGGRRNLDHLAMQVVGGGVGDTYQGIGAGAQIVTDREMHKFVLAGSSSD